MRICCYILQIRESESYLIYLERNWVRKILPEEVISELGFKKIYRLIDSQYERNNSRKTPFLLQLFREHKTKCAKTWTAGLWLWRELGLERSGEPILRGLHDFQKRFTWLCGWRDVRDFCYWIFLMAAWSPKAGRPVINIQQIQVKRWKTSEGTWFAIIQMKCATN